MPIFPDIALRSLEKKEISVRSYQVEFESLVFLQKSEAVASAAQIVKDIPWLTDSCAPRHIVLLPPSFLVRPDPTADRDFPYIQTQTELWQETEVILHESV